MVREKQIEENFINKLIELKYAYRSDICDRDSLEQNFRKKFERLNRVNLSDSEFNRLLEEITNSDVYISSKRLREINTFIREDGTPLQYTLVNIKDWCKNEYEVVNQLRINTKNSFQRYDVILLINGLPVVQVELKTLDVSPAVLCNRLWIIKMTQAMDMPIPYCVSCSCLLSATTRTHIILPITIFSISISMPKNNSYQFTNGQGMTTRK